ncbi:hypothetical protein QYM36_016648 [Artemia franciscana]|uniref:Uncharacterized protein n=1 Tax=Artemia franciscana TaxID=6661 RepID=A0AA88HC45_ARTSF|nr:hypothetical protein QYM36_016648 [Artemia franciscana]
MSARPHDALSVVIKVMNHIKLNSLQDRLFRELFNVAEIELSLQEPLIELQSDEITRTKSKDEKYNIWKTADVATKNPLLWDKAHRVPQMLSKARNRLDIVKRGDLRLSLTSIDPNIKKLVVKHQPQGSH